MPAVYVVTVRGVLFDQAIVNDFAYVDANVSSAPTALELLTLLGFIPTGSPPDFPASTVASAWEAIASESYQFLEAQCANLYSVFDFYTAPYSPAILGGIAVAAGTPTLAFGLKSNRVRTDIRRGFKRFAGVVDDATDAGGIIAPTFDALLTVLAAEMSAVLTGASASYQPAVLSYEAYTTPSGKTAYRPRATEALQLDHAAYPLTWAQYSQIRTQTSRQYGRGN